MLLFGAEFGLGTIGFLWPNLKGGFGSKINAGPLNDIKSQIDANSYVYVGQGRFTDDPLQTFGGAGAAVAEAARRRRRDRRRDAGRAECDGEWDPRGSERP